MTKTELRHVNIFSDKGIKTDVTLVFSAGQALLAAKRVQRSTPLIGRLDDISTDGFSLNSRKLEIYDNYAFGNSNFGGFAILCIL
jgi:transaldolase